MTDIKQEFYPDLRLVACQSMNTGAIYVEFITYDVLGNDKTIKVERKSFPQVIATLQSLSGEKIELSDVEYILLKDMGEIKAGAVFTYDEIYDCYSCCIVDKDGDDASEFVPIKVIQNAKGIFKKQSNSKTR